MELSATIPIGALLALLTNTLRGRRLTALALVDQQERTGVERARRIGVEERARVARELHDIVAHHISMVAVRAETAPFRLPDLSEETRKEFSEISQAARDSLNEIRSLLAVLRSDEAPRMPQPGLDQIEQLVVSTRHAGVEVSLTVQGEPRPLRKCGGSERLPDPPGGALQCHRHAADQAVDVWVEYGDASLELVVANACPTPPGPPGHGLTGMTERATAVGGTLSARRRADGRFVVAAFRPNNDPGARRRRSGDGQRRVHRPSRRRPRDPGGRRCRRRCRGGRRRPTLETRHRPDGRPHAGDGRNRGDSPDPRRRVRPDPRGHAHDVRYRRVRLRGDPSRRQRLPPQGRAGRHTRRGRQGGRSRRCPPRAAYGAGLV